MRIIATPVDPLTLKAGELLSPYCQGVWDQELGQSLCDVHGNDCRNRYTTLLLFIRTNESVPGGRSSLNGLCMIAIEDDPVEGMKFSEEPLCRITISTDPGDASHAPGSRTCEHDSRETGMRIIATPIDPFALKAGELFSPYGQEMWDQELGQGPYGYRNPHPYKPFTTLDLFIRTDESAVGMKPPRNPLYRITIVTNSVDEASADANTENERR